MNRLDECELPDTHTTLMRLWNVISNDHSVHQVDRHFILMETFLSVTGETIKLADLHLLAKIMGYVMHKAEIRSRYRDIFYRTLDLLKHSPTMEKSSDEINYKHYLVEIFNTLGCFLIQTTITEVKSKILEIVLSIITEKRVIHTNSLSTKACVHAIALSEFMECLADFIAIVEKDLYLWTIHIALQICLQSDLCCWTLLKKGIIENLLVRQGMIKEEERSDTLDVTFQLLWKLLLCTSHHEDWSKIDMPSKLALRSLRFVHREKAFANIQELSNVAAIILKMIHHFPNADYIGSGLFEDVVYSATLTEAIYEGRMCPRFKHERCHLQFKKLMLACLVSIPISNLSVTLLEQHRVPECLVTMLIGSTSYISFVEWNPEQTVDLFRCVLPIACTFFPYLSQQFIDANLIKTLMNVISIQEFKKNNLDETTHFVVNGIFLLCSCETNVESIHNALRESSALGTFLSMAKLTLKPDSCLTISLQSTLARILCILSALMQNKKELQIKHADISFYIVHSLYKRILKPHTNDSLIDNKLKVAVCNFAWEILIWSDENVFKFISSGEIFSHIDIMERSSFSVQLVFLSMLADVSEYQQSVPYLVSWRGKEGTKLLSVLCKIWRSEEDRLQVPRSIHGCVSDIEKPLMGKDQSKLSKEEKKRISSACDLFGSARPKICALFQLLQRHKEVKILCEEHYKLGHDQLPWKDQVTMHLIEAYLPLKLGEVWWEIRNKLGTVLPMDRYLADTLADRYLNWSLSVQRAQNNVLREHDILLRSEEQHYYSQLCTNRLTTALEALREVVAIARSADRQILLLAHQRLRQTIHDSRGSVEADVKLTYPDDLNVILVHSKTDVVLQSEADHRSST